MASRGEIYSTRANSERRTYFFNVKENRRGDVFLSIVESSKKEDADSFDRHQIMIYEEDLAEFMSELNKAAGIALKGDELRNPRPEPKKFRKKTEEPRQRPGNLRRKKVHLKHKIKRRES